MQNSTQKEVLSYIENILTVILSAFLFLFPLVFASAFTDIFAVPKQLLLGLVIGLSLLLLGARMLVLGKVQLRSTPFDLPVFLFIIAVLLSAVFAVNRYDALINFVPFLFAALLFFILVNVIKEEKMILFAISALVGGAGVAGLISVLSYFKIFIFPYAETQAQSFTTFGALLDQAMYIAIVLPFAGYIAWPFLARIVRTNRKLETPEALQVNRKSLYSFGLGFSIAGVALLAGLGTTLLLLLTIAKPIILPLETGFQTAFATISQDSGRILQGFLFGSGYGTYLTDFTRFKQSSYNLNPQLWSFTFFRSSSYVLELIATTGVLGIISFLFIGYRFLKEKTMFLPVVLVFIAAFILPFSYTIQVLFFIALALFSATQAISSPKRYEDLEFYFVAMKRGLIAAIPEHGYVPASIQESKTSRVLPILAMLVLMIFVGAIGYLSGLYVVSDMHLKKSLNYIAENKGLEAYNHLTGNAEARVVGAIPSFPYRDTNYRIFSQLNLALANSLAVSQPQGQQISQETQQTILTLIQQAITAGRNAVTVSPQTSLNWDNLSNIYRSLIGFGQNADQFAIITNQEAIRLDPANPQQYINLGGIFYQLQQWDQAQNQFQIAVQLKPDLANAYYNLGHALESKGDLQAALVQYQAVGSLVQNEKESLDKINQEIEALQAKIGTAQEAAGQQQTQGTAENQPPLGVNQPETQLPGRQPLEEIEGLTPSPSPSGKPTTSPSPASPSPTP
ncbi:MAG: tetratricopeptide repeat protein [Candidatus Levybacteria bacterium]|nr:tetratricopeptide repeat protein [Candidatus Levybacteria bacterium]